MEETRTPTRAEKKSWQAHQLVSELQKWGAYLQQSAGTFHEQLEGFEKRKVYTTAVEQKALQEIKRALLQLEKESALLRSRAHHLRGKQ